MADESTHPNDHDPEQAAPDSVEAKGQEETPEDDMSWLTFASPENPLSDMGLKITMGKQRWRLSSESTMKFGDERQELDPPFAVCPKTGTEFYSHNHWGGTQYGPGSENPEPLPSYLASGFDCGSSPQMINLEDVIYNFVLAQTAGGSWELWRWIEPHRDWSSKEDSHPDVDELWQKVGFTSGPLVDREVAERMLLIGHIRYWADDYAGESRRHPLSLAEPESNYYAWGLFVMEDDISWYDAPIPGPELVKYLLLWMDYRNPTLLKLIMGSDPAAAWSYLRQVASQGDRVPELMDDICRICGVDRSSKNPIQARFG